MRPLTVCACLCLSGAAALAQPAISEPPEFPQVAPGPLVTYFGTECFLAAQGQIVPGDVDWIRIRLPRASARTVIDVDFPAGASGSAMLAMVQNGTTGFNIADNNNTRDALCGLHAASSPQGSTRDSVVDVRETSIQAVIDIAVTGAADTSFVGLHNESFTYELWVYALPYPCMNDAACDDGIACTLDQCNAATGDCANTPQDAECDDGFFCNGPEWCDASLGCRTSVMPTCDDGVDCTDDYCDFGEDRCVNEPWNEFCDNLIFCDGAEWCHATAGCQAGTPVDCDDGVACTADSCDEESWSCTHAPSDSVCDDGLYCNGVETCHADSGCSTGDPPCGEALCRESDDRCVECLTDADCDDGRFCNGGEFCSADGNCSPGEPPCNAEPCRESDDQCVECLGDDDCADEFYCNGQELCDASGQCAPGTPPCEPGQTCDDDADQCLGADFTLDISPGACPAKVTTSNRGYLSMALVGTGVRDVDVRSLRLVRADGVGAPVQPVSSPRGQAPRLVDVSGPGEPCVCPDPDSDGVADLLVSFKIDEVARSLRLDKMGRKISVELTLTGKRRDGTSFSASDCLTMLVTGNPNAAH
jgi:hypothetical protein